MTERQIRFVTILLKSENVKIVDMRSVEDRKTANISTMTVGLLDTYSEKEFRDLLANLQSVRAFEETQE